MFLYDKKLQYPVKIDKPNPRLAAIIISQYGGPDGELGASLRYLSQRYSMPFDELKGLLTDIGTEELAHLEIIATLVYKLTKDTAADKAAVEKVLDEMNIGSYTVTVQGSYSNEVNLRLRDVSEDDIETVMNDFQSRIAEKYPDAAFDSRSSVGPVAGAALLKNAIFSVLIGVPMAYLMTRFNIWGKTVWHVLIILSLMCPPFLGAYAWIMLFGRAGSVTTFLAKYGVTIGTLLAL